MTSVISIPQVSQVEPTSPVKDTNSSVKKADLSTGSLNSTSPTNTADEPVSDITNDKVIQIPSPVEIKEVKLIS